MKNNSKFIVKVWDKRTKKYVEDKYLSCIYFCYLDSANDFIFEGFSRHYDRFYLYLSRKEV